MNTAGILHIPDSRYCFALSTKELVIRLRVAKEDNDIAVTLVYGPKYHYHEYQKELAMYAAYTDHTHTYYEITLSLDDVRLAYIFKLEQSGHTYYFSEDGLTTSYDFSNGFYNFFQMPYINAIDVHQTVPWVHDAVFYQIFVDRFHRGDFEKDDSYINMAWLDRPTPDSFAGGDLKGITDKLEYLDDLGVNVIYLTPIFKSISNHKYDISDYYAIDPMFGTSFDLQQLINEAHQRGIKIILDAVFNHASSDCEPFQDVLAHGSASPFFDWFMIQGDQPSVELANYETFADCHYMPKWNTSHRAVQDYLIGIGLYWITEYHIDGWRLDVSDEVSHDFWRRFRKAVKAVKSDAILIGENWHDAYPYLQGDQYDGIMNYAFTKACLDYFAFDAISSQEMAERLSHILMRNTWQVNQMNLNLLDSHDTHRFLTQVNGSKDKLLAGLALLVTFMGIPCIYYGTELAMEGGYDPDSRRSFNWDSSTWDMSFWNQVKDIISLRRHAVIQSGSISITSHDDCLCVKRELNGQSIRLLVNNGVKPYPIEKGGSVLVSNGVDKETCELLQNGFVVSY
ncbi:glycoside hydrolase family 13 protein [Streptococcus equi subsp. zooepidemicus]|uniref:glycoside hydrolase family 13 protein n=1 Tax=Streptococcus equi TaxID=1336 RepID=UPI0013F622EC|nr:glycoside hydrolase family 13 protein [Streptococcus equi]MCD3433503.1 glycoside hydrolase family 13 protein [Streptococcus equi subsp. zooepidemicus]MDI5954123.1 glycoside hydrolase family 13 protein [Streptococcus equi subsp. zooepidemicus]QTZ59136.1 Cyclomaltodextrinase [Streptococcus equi subsp. zooepidemicus]QUF61841.1 alpha-glycosidase [Streptococcus equi subsp. zooepidemicus]QWN60542.1 alpha-glycosidase [Streptococcus equi subsp. zooepidemicus]